MHHKRKHPWRQKYKSRYCINPSISHSNYVIYLNFLTSSFTEPTRNTCIQVDRYRRVGGIMEDTINRNLFFCTWPSTWKTRAREVCFSGLRPKMGLWIGLVSRLGILCQKIKYNLSVTLYSIAF